MKTYIPTLFTILFISAFGCGRHHGEAAPIQLNSGERWEANPETTEGINNMIQIMNSAAIVGAEIDYLGVKEELEHEFFTIFKRCTMKGEAHNQLHNYLFPMKELFDGLGSDDRNIQNESFSKIHAYLPEYAVYFK